MNPWNLSHLRWPLLWLAVVLGGMLLLAFAFARAVSAADEGITLNPATDLAVTEGVDASYTVVLTGDTPPMGEVTVEITTSNGDVTFAEGSDGSRSAGTVAGESVDNAVLTLTFTADNYTMPQTVMVMADDDDTLDEIARLTHVVGATDAADTAFNDIDDAVLRVTVTDDDVAGVTFSSGTGDDAFDPTTMALAVPETDAAVDVATYTVVLDAEPGADVTVTISSNNADVTFRSGVRSAGMIDGEDVANTVLTLTFTDDNWDDTQNVETQVAADMTTEDESATLTHVIASADGGYNALADQTVMINVTDDDVADLTFSETSLDVIEEAQGTYTVALAAQPTADVTVTISSSDNGAVGVRTNLIDAFGATAQLMFTMDNYNTAKTVTVLARMDGNAVSENVVLTHTVASADDKFDGSAIIDAAVEAVDDTLEGDALEAALVDARNSLNVMVEAIDTSPGIRLSMDTLMLVDGADSAGDMLTMDYTLTLQADPAGTVTVMVMRSDSAEPNGDVDVTPASTTFSAGTLERTFTVRLTDDLDTAAEAPITLSHTITSDSMDDGDYTSLSPEVLVTFKDEDPAGVTFTGAPVAVSEGASATYTVVLRAPPTAPVTVAITSDDTDVTVEPMSLTFVAADAMEGQALWNAAQTVTVMAGADIDNVGETVKLSHAVSSDDAKFKTQELIDAAVAAVDDTLEEDALATATDAAMNSLNVTVNVTDTSAGVRLSVTELELTESGADGRYTVVLQKAPTADVEVRISTDNADVTFAAGTDGARSDAMIDGESVTDAVVTMTFTPANYATEQDVVVDVALDDATDDESATLTHTVKSNDIDYDQIIVKSVAVDVADDTRAVELSIDEPVSLAEGGMTSFTVKLSEAPQPNTTVTVTVDSDNAAVEVDTDAEMDENQDTLTFTPDDFEMPQTVMVMAPDNNDDADTNPTATITVSSTGGYSSATVMIEVLDDDITGVAISQMAPVMEGGSGEISVVLGTEPTADVMVTISSADTAVLTVDGADVETGELILTFTMDNFAMAQTFMVVAAEDNDFVDGIATLTVMVSSTDLAYAARTATQPVFISDNDAVVTPSGKDVVVSALAALIEGESGSFNVRLTAEPSANVTINVSSDNPALVVDGADAVTGVLTQTFTALTYSSPQTVMVTAAEDDDTEHARVLITVDVSSTDTDYDTRDKTVAVFVADNDPVEVAIDEDVPGLAISSLAAVIEGQSGSFTVRLNTAPTAEVTIAVSSDNTDVTVEPMSLTFTVDNYAMAQSVIVTAGQDADTAHGAAAITLMVSSTDSDYSALADRTVSVFIADDDPVTVTNTVTKTVTRTVTAPAPAAPGPSAPMASDMMMGAIGSTSAATATEVDGRVMITRHDGGASLTIDIGGFIRDADLGQTYQVVRRADGAIVRQWVSPNSPLVYQIPWAVVNSSFTVPVGVIGSIPLDDMAGAEGQLVRRFDGGDDRIFSYAMGQWRHVPDIATFQALGFYWCDVTAADASFFDRISMGAPHPASSTPASMDYPSCSTG